MSGKANDQVVHRHGDFIWYELLTPDTTAAKTFYGGLLGWSFETHEASGTDYHVVKAAELGIGGMLQIAKEMADHGARPLWAGYIYTEEVDATAAAVEKHGGEIFMPPFDIPGVGRIAFVADPQGAPFYIMNPTPPAGADPGPSQAFAAYQPAVGHCAWNELLTADPAAAKHWYGKLFGFIKDGGIDMGPELGEYEFMKNEGQDFVYGAVMKKPATMPASLWIYYFRVPDIDKAVDYIRANGAQIINGPMEIPGGDFVLQGIDPQDALFALIGKRN